jgi:DNA-directed RNA polymerase specialized sigma24 family protein
LLDLHVIDELTHAEIAIRLNLNSAVASRKRLQRIRSQILSRLRETVEGSLQHKDRGRRTNDDSL